MKRWTTLLLLPLLAACSKAPEVATDPAAQTIEVAIGSGPRLDITTQSATRTTLDEEGTQVKWQTGDQLALWAVNSASQRVIEAATFSLYHYNASYNSASFRGSIPALAEDTYSYYAVSPVPAATDGLQVSYDIPAVQDGTFHGEWDVMVAKPVTGEALREHDRKDANGISDNSDIVNLQFAHKIHVLKITLPKNDLGEPITEIELTFPTAVTGRLTVDASNPEADATLSGGSKTLTLRFAEPKDAGDVVYAMIAPVTLEEGQQISILAVGESSESESRTFAPASADRTFAAGHTTPINYNVPGLGRMFTRLNFRLDEAGANTLGEEIDSFTVTAPEGWVFEDGTRSRTFDVTGTGDYLVRFRDYPNQTAETSGFQVTYDSEHALLTETFTLPAVTPETLNQVAAFRVPYLFEEDFSGVEQTIESENTELLTNYNLADWGGSRYSMAPGRLACAVWVASSTEGIFGGSHCGRLDSPVLPLKKSANIKVSYNIGGTQVTGAAFFGTSYWVSVCQFGTETNPASFPISGEENTPTNLIETFRPATGASMTGSLPTPKEYTINAEVGTRLSWRCSYEMESSTGSSPTLTRKTLYLYLDDIKVSIAQ